MNLRLIKGSCEYQKEILDMLREWRAYNQAHPEANRSPRAIFRNDEEDFDSYLEGLDHKGSEAGMVPDSTYFCLDEDRGILVGAVNIRHSLNDYLLQYGGHIGDGIRPSERRKGYATEMIALALEECRRLGIRKVLMVCDKDNMGSARSITKNGGILENEVEEEGKLKQRYWITLPE